LRQVLDELGGIFRGIEPMLQVLQQIGRMAGF
jgi:hypothetical protein